jgi:Na+/melibiose symporter-like transporter
MTYLKQSPGAVADPTRAQITLWSLVSIIGTMMLLPLNALIPAFYAKYTAVTLAEVGFVFLVARLYDAFADPLVGFLSDRTRSPLGRRKPWLLAGAFLTAVSGWLMFNPAPSASVGYLLPVALVFYTAYSMLSVPHSAWGAELTTGYQQRSFISGLLTFAGVFGLLLFMGLPVLLSSPILPLFPSAEITPPMLKLMGWLVILGAPLFVLPAVLFTPRGSESPAGEKVELKDLWRSAKVNPPLWWFMSAYLMSSLGYGVYYATTYMFVDSYLGMADRFPIIYAIAAIAQIVTIPFWTWMAQRFERHHIWAFGIAGFGLVLPVRLLLPTGDEGFWSLVALTLIGSALNAASQVPQMAVLADCVDYAKSKLGKSLAGTYYAAQHFVLKASLAIGGAAGFFALQILGYQPKDAAHTAQSLSGLAWVHTAGPMVLFLICAVLLLKFPLNRKHQGEIQDALATP